jgi:membrane dipeptidase
VSLGERPQAHAGAGAGGERPQAHAGAGAGGPRAHAGAAALHAGALVWDAHADSMLRSMVEGYDLAGGGAGHADLERWRAGGVDVQVFAVWVDTIYVPHYAAHRALRQIDALHRFVEAHAHRVALARSAADVRRITGDGRMAALIALEGGAAVQNDPALLRTFHRLGVTSLTLTHSATTGWADSATDEARWNGLNDLGRVMVREMNRLGMVVDVSHTSDATVRDVLATSRAPVIASHSACRALCDHPRNLSDELLRAIAADGGVVGINFYPGFLDDAARLAMEEAGELLRMLNRPVAVAPERLDDVAAERHRGFFAEHALPPVRIERVFDHIDHAVAVAGIDHVGLGSDFDGINATPVGLDGVHAFPRLTEGLLARGYAEGDVAKVLGGNFLRVFEEVAG